MKKAICGYLGIYFMMVSILFPQESHTIEKMDNKSKNEEQKRWPLIIMFGRYWKFMPNERIFKEVYGNGYGYSGELRIKMVKSVYVSIEAGYYNKNGYTTLTKDKTTITIYPIDVKIIAHPVSWYVTPYIGAGYSMCKYEEKSDIGRIKDNGFGFNAVGGIYVHWRFIGIDTRVMYKTIIVMPMNEEINLGGISVSIAVGINI